LREDASCEGHRLKPQQSVCVVLTMKFRKAISHMKKARITHSAITITEITSCWCIRQTGRRETVKLFPTITLLQVLYYTIFFVWVTTCDVCNTSLYAEVEDNVHIHLEPPRLPLGETHNDNGRRWRIQFLNWNTNAHIVGNQLNKTVERSKAAVVWSSPSYSHCCSSLLNTINYLTL